jgi:hypothetical protein
LLDLSGSILGQSAQSSTTSPRTSPEKGAASVVGRPANMTALLVMSSPSMPSPRVTARTSLPSRNVQLSENPSALGW